MSNIKEYILRLKDKRSVNQFHFRTKAQAEQKQLELLAEYEIVKIKYVEN